MNLFLRQAPFVRFLGPFLFGILLSLRLENLANAKPIILGTVILALILLLTLDKVWKQMSKSHFYGLLSQFVLFLLGLGLGIRAMEGHVYPPEADRYIAIVESTPVEKQRSYAVNLNVYRFQSDSASYQSCNFRLIGYFSKNSFNQQIIPGQSILFSGYLMNKDQERYPYQFDYGRYLRNTGISGTIYIPENEYHLIQNDYFSFRGTLNSFRSRLIEKMNEDSIPLMEYGVISALLVGDRSFLDPELRDDFADAGAVHILAVSGLHVGIIYMLFLYVLNFIFRDKAALLKLLLILLILWGYAALTGFSPSVLRAATMFSFIAVGKHHKRYSNTYNMVAASALFLLLIDPLLISQVGFQLSYLAVIGIIFFQPRFHAFIKVKNKYLDMVWSLFCVSLAAQLATFPLSIYYFHQFPILFFLTNLLVIPFATLILYAGIPWLILLWLPWVSDILGLVTVFSTRVLNWFIGRVNSIPFAKIEGIYLNEISVLLIYLMIISSTVFFTKPSRLKLRLCGATLICLTFLWLNRRVSNTLQDEIIIPTLGDEVTIARMTQDQLLIYTSDTLNFLKSWQRELSPYFLTRGISSENAISFVDFANETAPLFIVDSLNLHESQHIVWNSSEEMIKIVDADIRLNKASDSSLLRFRTDNLSRFSAYSPRLLK